MVWWEAWEFGGIRSGNRIRKMAWMYGVAMDGERRSVGLWGGQGARRRSGGRLRDRPGQWAFFGYRAGPGHSCGRLPKPQPWWQGDSAGAAGLRGVAAAHSCPRGTSSLSLSPTLPERVLVGLATCQPGWLYGCRAGGGRAAAVSWRAGLWERLAVPSVSTATSAKTARECVCVCIYMCTRACAHAHVWVCVGSVFAAGSVVPWQPPHKPAQRAALGASHLGVPTPRPIYNQFPG